MEARNSDTALSPNLEVLRYWLDFERREVDGGGSSCSTRKRETTRAFSKGWMGELEMYEEVISEGSERGWMRWNVDLLDDVLPPEKERGMEENVSISSTRR